jgi:hypothetical protein
VLVGSFLALLAFDGVRRGHINNGDSGILVRGASEILNCVSQGIWRECALGPGTGRAHVGPFPLLQYLPAMVLTSLEIDTTGILRGLAALNLLVLAGTVAALWITFWKRGDWRWLAPIAVVVVVSGPVAYYGTTSFAEMLAASALLAASLAAYHRSPTFTFAFTLLATISKETLAPFVLALTGVALVLSDRRSHARPWAVPVSAVLGTAAGIALNAGFNVFRFGTPENLTYLQPLFRVPDLATAAEFFAMLNLSPASGVLFFWPLGLIVVIVTIAVAALRLIREPRDVRRWLPPAVVGLAYVAFVAGLSHWYSPFGWISWGPRLVVPILPTLVFLGLVILSSDRGRNREIARLGIWLPITIALVAMLVSLPQWSGPWTHAGVMAALVAPDSTCEGLTQVVIQSDQDEYYRCVSHFAWRSRPSWIDDAVLEGGPPAWLARILGSAAIATLIATSYQRLRLDPPELNGVAR